VTNVTALARHRNASARIPPKTGRLWKIFLAGKMQVSRTDGDGIPPLPRKARALIAYLCLAPASRASRGTLATLLWDKTDERARRNLRHALFDIDRIDELGDLICSDQQDVWLNDATCWIDVLAEPDQYTERLLDDLDGVSEGFHRWLNDQRKQFEDRARRALYDQVAQLESEGASPERRATAARKLLNFDATHEDGLRALMKALADEGRHIQALREYQRFRAELWEAFEARPSRQTASLYEAIRIASSRDPAKSSRPARAEVISLNAEGGPADRGNAPTIAVLPFNNLLGDPRYNGLADSLAHDLAGLLSRLPGFFVTSHLTARTFRHQDDRLPQDIGDLLDVRYILSGVLRVDGSRLYLNAELTDTIKGTVLLSTGIEEAFSNFIDVPRRLASEVVKQAAPKLRAAELSRIRGKYPEQLNAYDYFLLAQESMYHLSPTVFARAEGQFDAALARDPQFAIALAARAHWHLLRIGQGWSDDPARDQLLADEYASRALDGDQYEPMAYAIQGHIASYLHRDFDTALDRFDDALHLDPNTAHAWMWSAATSVWVGDGKSAVEKITRGAALSPYDPLMYFSTSVAGMAYLADGQYERAVEYAYLSLRESKNYAAGHRHLVIALMLAGRADEARSAVQRLLAVEPNVTVERFRSRFPGRDSPQAQLYCEALRDAGVPRA